MTETGASSSRNDELAQWDTQPLLRQPTRVTNWVEATHLRQWVACLVVAGLAEAALVGVLLWIDSGRMQWGNVPTWVGANLTAAAIALALATAIADRRDREAERRDESKQQARLITVLPHPDDHMLGNPAVCNYSDKPVFRLRIRQASSLMRPDKYSTLNVRYGENVERSLVDDLQPGESRQILGRIGHLDEVNDNQSFRLNGQIEIEFTDAQGVRWRKTYPFVGYKDSDPEQVSSG